MNHNYEGFSNRFNNKSLKGILAGIVTLLVITLLILSGPAAAFNLSISSFSSTPTKGDKISTTATISVLSNERMPFPNDAGIYVNSKLVCSFAVDATKTECSGVTVDLLSNTALNDYGYGYANGQGFGYGYQQGYSNGVFTYNLTFDTDKLSIGDNNIQIKVNAGGSASESQSSPSVLTVKAAENQQQANEPTETVTNDTTEIVFDDGSSSVDKVVINSSIDDTKKIDLDMSFFLNDSKVNVSNELTLERQGDITNYTAIIPAGTIITGDAGWDGKITLPTVTTVTTTLGTVDVAVEMGSNVSLTFSDAVKIILAGMTGKKALWANSTGSYSIALCTDGNSTSAGSLTSGECYVDTGSDLVIWTYHFTSFGAYTPSVATSSSSGSSGAGGAYKPYVKLSNVSNVAPEQNNTSPEAQPEAAQKGFLAFITGAVIGALGTTGTTVAVIFIVAIIVALVIVSRRRKAGKTKKGKKESDEDED